MNCQCTDKCQCTAENKCSENCDCTENLSTQVSNDNTSNTSSVNNDDNDYDDLLSLNTRVTNINIKRTRSSGVEHNYHKYIHIRDEINNKMRNMQFNNKNIIHLLLDIMERVNTLTLTNVEKDDLSMYIFQKMLDKYRIYCNSDYHRVKDYFPKIINEFSELSAEKLFSKSVIHDVMQPNIITYTVYECFDELEVFDPIAVIFNVMEEIYRYAKLNVEEKKSTTMKVMDKLFKHYDYSDESNLLECLLPDLIDCIIAIYNKQYNVTKLAEIEEVDSQQLKNKSCCVCQ